MEDCTVKSGSRQQVLKCGVCHRIYRSRKVLARHMYKHEHPVVFTCSDCGKTFPTKTRLNIHSRVHSGDRPFKCCYCSWHCSSTFQLRLHHRRHTGEKPYICSYCQKSFSSSSGLQQHVKTHTNESPFSCSQCSRSFKQREKLKQHERIHSGVRPYMCDRCPSTFRVKNSLIRHLRIHSGEMFKCTLCPKEFGELYSVKKHHRRQHGKLPFTSAAKKSVSEDKTMSLDTDSSLVKNITASPAQIKKNTLKNKKQVQRISWRKVKHTSDAKLNKIVAEKLHLTISHGNVPDVDESGWHRIPLPASSDLLTRNVEPHNGNLKKVTAVLNARRDDLLQCQSSAVEAVSERKECLAADICEQKPANVNQPDLQGQPASDAGSSTRETTRASTIEYFPSTDQTPRCENGDNRESTQFVVSPPAASTSGCYVQDPLCVPQGGDLLLRCFHSAYLEDCGAVFPRFYSRLCHQNLQDTEQTSNPGSFYHSSRLCQLGDKHHHHHHHHQTATLNHHSDVGQTGDLPAYCCGHEQCNSLSSPQEAQATCPGSLCPKQEAQATCPGSLWPKQQFQGLQATAFHGNPHYIQHHLPSSYQQKSLDLTQLQTPPGLIQLQTSPGLSQLQTPPDLTQLHTSSGLTQLHQLSFPVTLPTSSSSSVPCEHKSLPPGVVSSALPFRQSFVEKTYQPLLCRQASVRSGHQCLPQQDCVTSNQPSLSQHESVQSNHQSISKRKPVKSDCHFSHMRLPITSIDPLLQDHEVIQSNQQLLQQQTSATADQQQPPESNQLEQFCNSCLTGGSSTEPGVSASRGLMLGDTAARDSVQTCSDQTSNVVHHRPSCLGPPDSPGEAGSDHSWQTYPHKQQSRSNTDVLCSHRTQQPCLVGQTQTDVLCSHRTQQPCLVGQTQTDVLCSHRTQQPCPQARRASISLCESERTEGAKKESVCFDRIQKNVSKVRRRNKHRTCESTRREAGTCVGQLGEGEDSCQPWVVVAASSQTPTEVVSQLGSIPHHVHVASDKNRHLPCGKDESQASRLEQHKSRRQADMGRHECHVCSKQFPYRSHLQRHMNIHVAQKPYPCHLCPQMFTAKKYLDNHIGRHNKRPAILSCTDCRMIFGRSYQLKIHMRTHSGEKPYKCSQCSRHFATSFQVKLHERVHSDVRPYQCQHCSKYFRSKANLALHVRRHINDRPYVCVPCGAAFYEASKLIAHVRVHTGVHPFMCDQCPKTFKVKHLLVRHLRWHSGDTFNCEHCNKQFDEKWTLRAHIARRHSKK